MDSIRIFDNIEAEIKQPDKLNLTDMKVLKNTLTLFALIAVFSTTALAQTETANVSATAVVEATLSLTVDRNVDFGTIEPLAAYLQAGTGDPTSSTNTTGSFGLLTIDGTDGITVNVSFTDATLENSNSEVITFTPAVFNGSNEVNTTNNTVTLTGGTAQLAIGGSLTAAPGPGSYSTATSADPVVFTVEYL